MFQFNRRTHNLLYIAKLALASRKQKLFRQSGHSIPGSMLPFYSSDSLLATAPSIYLSMTNTLPLFKYPSMCQAQIRMKSIVTCGPKPIPTYPSLKQASFKVTYIEYLAYLRYLAYLPHRRLFSFFACLLSFFPLFLVRAFFCRLLAPPPPPYKSNTTVVAITYLLTMTLLSYPVLSYPKA